MSARRLPGVLLQLAGFGETVDAMLDRFPRPGRKLPLFVVRRGADLAEVASRWPIRVDFTVPGFGPARTSHWREVLNRLADECGCRAGGRWMLALLGGTFALLSSFAPRLGWGWGVVTMGSLAAGLLGASVAKWAALAQARRRWLHAVDAIAFEVAVIEGGGALPVAPSTRPR